MYVDLSTDHDHDHDNHSKSSCAVPAVLVVLKAIIVNTIASIHRESWLDLTKVSVGAAAATET